MISNLHIYKSPDELAEAFANQLISWISDFSGNAFHLAISGGKTPDLLFSILAQKKADSGWWHKVHFWWVDERMVPPDDPESNFGTANRLLFSHIIIPKGNIHRIKGENDPETEAHSYSEQIQQQVTQQNGWPAFDLILLGMGDDGHTASIFPNQMSLLDSNRICEVAVNPQSGQKRVTLTGRVINQAMKVCFIVTGTIKAERMAEISSNEELAEQLPAAHIQPLHGTLDWYLDEPAVQYILPPPERPEPM
ncbi:MAG TPA: 6-phosphogluconolactonase [Prolixibacteraceae bacterium]|jgi:6-phosphogluconolactonase